jgi:hypothetical protein
MVNERNREIEAIIEKLGDETHSTQKQLKQSYEHKLDQVVRANNEEISQLKN